MSNLEGMDTEQVLHLSRILMGGSGQVTETINRAQQLIEGLNWVGPDRDVFVSSWHDTHCPRLISLVEELKDASLNAHRYAVAQQLASSADEH